MNNDTISINKKIRTKMVQEAEKIKNHSLTIAIKYPQYKEAFDFVHEHFPSAEVKNKRIYMCDKTFLDELGYTEIAGFYNDVVDMIVAVKDSESYGYISEDEAIVHELLHSVSADKKDEEFAYTKSVLYFLKKGRDRDYIIRYMSPYLNKEIEKTKQVLIEKYKVILEKELKESIYKIINQTILRVGD